MLMRPVAARTFTAAMLVLAFAAAAAAGAPPAVAAVDAAALAARPAADAEWVTFAGSYNGHRHSRLARIDRGNVARLQVRWEHALERHGSIVESTPLVSGGRLFVTDPAGSVTALDARTGARLWRFARSVPPGALLCCGAVNRGVALLGERVYVTTIDANLVALDAATGAVQWEVPIAEYRAGYSATGAPLAVRDMIVTGIAGGEFRTRGFVAAFDARTGALRWRTHTVAAPGEPGSESWSGDSWRTGGGPTWMTGTYDPARDLIFWGTGNPAPDYDAGPRRGDNLFTNSLLALDAATGRRVWHFQYTPGDVHDWDAVQVPVLVDLRERGGERALVLVANRNGFYYVLERTSGRFLRARPFVRQTWARGVTRAGRPLRRPEATPTQDGVLVHPGRVGGTNWWPPAYSPTAGVLLVPALEQAGIFFQEDDDGGPEEQYLRGRAVDAPGPGFLAVRALEPRTGRLRWEHRFAARSGDLRLCGLLSTAGGLVFGGEHTRLFALDVHSGALLWSAETDEAICAPPITYAIDGEQFVAMAAGGRLIAWALPR